MPSNPSFTVLQIRDFRQLILHKFLLTFGTQMVAIIVGWQIYQMTRDPLSLGLIGLSEAAAFIIFALWAGHVADHSEKRRLILAADALIVACVLALAALTWGGNTRTLPIYIAIAFTGLARAFLWSASTSYVQLIVPKEIYSQAAAWNSSAWEIATILGPATGGLLYALVGPRSAYGVALGCIALSYVFAWKLTPLPVVAIPQKERIWESLTSGMRFVFSHQILLAALALDMFAVLFGGVTALLPIFAEILKVGPMGLGFLRASQSLGAITMALFQTRRAPWRHPGHTLLAAVALFGVCIIAFGLSTNFYLSMTLLAFAGMADNVSVVLRASLVQAATPDALRGRVSAINGIFIGSSNELGAFESGLAAKLLGTAPAVLFGGAMTLITVAVTAWKAPKLRGLKTIANVGPTAEDIT